MTGNSTSFRDDPLQKLRIPSRMEVIQEHQGRGGKVAAVFPIHYPRELLRSFDILPVEVWGPPKVKANLGASHLQPYVCSIVQNGLSFLLSGGLQVADLLLVPHACDSLQGLGSVLIDFTRPKQPVLTLYLPRGERSSDLVFLVQELHVLFDRLCQITGHTSSDSQLIDCILREEEADRFLVDLHRRRPLPDPDLYRLIRSREYLPSETFIQLAKPVLDHPDGTSPNGIPLLLSGILPEPVELFHELNQMGGQVVADDFACTGRRLYPAGSSNEPFRCMAERILGAPPDPMRGAPIHRRSEHLLQLAGSTGARGVIFYDVKFCEPELFDLPLLRQGLSQAGIPSLTVEVDVSDQLSQTVLNRIAAFLEMLG